MAIELDLDTVYTTQDAAVAVAFLITEIVEFAMLHAPADPIEVSLRRTSELTARLTTLLGDAALRWRMGTASRELVAEHAIGATLDRFEDIYRAAIARTAVTLRRAA